MIQSACHPTDTEIELLLFSYMILWLNAWQSLMYIVSFWGYEQLKWFRANWTIVWYSLTWCFDRFNDLIGTYVMFSGEKVCWAYIIWFWFLAWCSFLVNILGPGECIGAALQRHLYLYGKISLLHVPKHRPMNWEFEHNLLIPSVHCETSCWLWEINLLHIEDSK